MSNFQGKNYEEDITPAKSNRGLKRRRDSSPDESGTLEPFATSPSPNATIDQIKFESDDEADTITIKYEMIDNEEMVAGPSATSTGLEEDMIEDIKIEQEEDPLMIFGGSNASFETVQSENNKEALTEKCCDEGYSPGSAINLPRVDAFAVSEFIAASPDIDKEQSRKIWRQPREELNDSIGYVQIKRETIICTVKCVIATKTTAYNCTIAYNEANDWVVAVFCDGCETLCHHGVTGLVWLCSHDRRPGSYWMEPLITMDGKSLRISEIYGFTKPSYPTLNTVMDEFIRIAQEKKILNPALMYLYQDVKTEAALHKLMCQFKRKFNTMDSGHFMEFCRKNINEGNIAKLEPMSPEERYALEYGRITDALLHDVCQNDDVEGLIRKITFPDVQENVEATPFLIESLERALKMKIKKCGILILPIFAASPYGTTDTHVVHIQYSKSTGINEQNLSPKDNASLQLQMFLAKKENACLCTVYENNKINVTIVKFNQMRVAHMLAKATVFWQTRIFRQIVMDN